MELEQHVLSAIDDFDKDKVDSALMHACFAIEATSRRLFSKEKATRTDYKKTIRQYYWIIEPMIGGGLNLEDTRWQNLTIDDGNGKILPNPDFADVIYHIFRCSHAHGRGVPQDYDLLPVEDGKSTWIIAHGKIQMPVRVIWALLAVSVFSKANTGVVSKGAHYLSWGSETLGIGTHKFPIKDSWGKEDDFRALLAEHQHTRVTLEKLHRVEKTKL